MTEPVLSTRELNRAVLARQLLLERSPLPLTEALEQVAGLQTQYAPSAYVGLWSRLKDFRRVATRYDRQPYIFMAAVFLASMVAFWL